MEVVLIILGVLGFGAILIAGYVFTVAARNYVSEDSLSLPGTSGSDSGTEFIARFPGDRRRAPPARFPLTVNSVVIRQDRRKLADRRADAYHSAGLRGT